jgi:hypothetical protein
MRSGPSSRGTDSACPKITPDGRKVQVLFDFRFLTKPRYPQDSADTSARVTMTPGVSTMWLIIAPNITTIPRKLSHQVDFLMNVMSVTSTEHIPKLSHILSHVYSMSDIRGVAAPTLHI